ncbi:MAG: hypothetical protein E7667_05695 [Ruminococcaceae bacterium]|nr:hypothetical protein [Oscillospiraceae bacterium]
MYSRNSRVTESITVPENYSGNAFHNNIYTDLVPGDLASEQDEQDKTENALPQKTSHSKTDQSFIELTPEHKSTQTGKSIFSSLLPNISQTPHFPFGHGLGSEELFILGIMLLIYMSADNAESVDSELLLLLCILLFSG